MRIYFVVMNLYSYMKCGRLGLDIDYSKPEKFVNAVIG